MANQDSRFFNVIASVLVLFVGVLVVDRVAPGLLVAIGITKTSEPPAGPQPVQLSEADWQATVATGHWMGSREAPVTIVEFGDFECPACRQFTTKALAAIQAKYPTEVAVLFRHWPLEMHKFAYPAARAAECAAAQGQFGAMHNLLYAKQDSLGLKAFAEYAQESGVSDMAAFDKCNRVRDKLAVVDADAELAKKVGGTGTPTIVINGLRLPGGVNASKLDSLVQVALQARK